MITHVALQQSDELRARFMANISTYDPGTLIWIDESGHDKRKSMRKYGYSMRGVRPIERRLLVRGVDNQWGTIWSFCRGPRVISRTFSQ